jgi:hypothetical protein
VTREEPTLDATAIASGLTAVGAGGLVVRRRFLFLDQATLQFASELLADLFDRLLNLGEGLGAGGQVGVQKKAQARQDLLAKTITLGLWHGNAPG